MTFRPIAPDPALALFISGYLLITGEQGKEEMIDLLPEGGVSLMLNLGAGPRSTRFDRCFDEHAPLMVGAMTGGDRQTLSERSRMLVINF